MTRFGFVIHPLTPRDAARKYPFARFLPDWVIERFLAGREPFVVGQIEGVRSITGATTDGVFIGCPLTPAMMTGRLELERVYDRIVQCTELAEMEGAKLVGLGAFTSVVGDGGITVAKRSPIPVTTGNSYTVATAIDGALLAAEKVGITPAEAVLAVVGATGSIGHTCALALSPLFARTLVIGRDRARTEAVARELPRASASDRVADIREADVIVSVTSSDSAIIQPEFLRTGSVICDVARPRDVSVRVGRERPDVLVVEGGVVAVPGNVSFGVDFGFPQGTAYACMSETMILALEDRAEAFTLGKSVSLEQVQQMRALATKHGFNLAGFRSFEREVPETTIERVRRARAGAGKSANPAPAAS